MPKWSPKIENHIENSPRAIKNVIGHSKDIVGMMDFFSSEIPTSSIDNLIISESIYKQIRVALNRIKYHEILFDDWNLKEVDPTGKKVAINFYGPSGTGKTFCAEGIAQHLGLSIIKVKYSEIESKYVGDTNKAITAAFMKAHATNSVLFFDEADSILGARLTQVAQAADHGMNVSRSTMLLELDKFKGVVLFATNLPENFDTAFVRRILAHIQFELPDMDCRMKLWNKLMPSQMPRAEDVIADWLAQESHNFAGGDILNAIILAASLAVARTGDERRVLRSDLLEAISQVRISKENVGKKEIKRNIQEHVEIVDYESLPKDVKDSYDNAVASSLNGYSQNPR